MASSQLEVLLVRIRHDEVDHPGTVLLESQRLQQQVVLVFWDVVLDVDQPVLVVVGLEDVRVRLLADLALKLLPSVGYQVLVFFLLHLLLQPVFEAVVVDVSDRPITLAGIQEGILDGGVGLPADFALDISVALVCSSALNLDALLFEFLS